MSAKYVLRVASDGAGFTYEDSAGRVIITGRRYETAGSARGAIASIRVNAAIDGRYERLIARSGHPYFNLKAGNGKIVGTSLLFGSPQERHAAIEAMQRDAPSAPIVTPPARD